MNAGYELNNEEEMNIILHICYKTPVVINGWKVETDTITFSDREEFHKFICGKVAYDFLDNAVIKKENEILLYAESSNGKIIWKAEENKKMGKMFKTTDEITKFFIENGWNEHTSFSELTLEEAKAHGYGAVIEGMNKGHKYFKMNVTGNIFDEKGEIFMYNISTVNEENKRRKIVADEKGLAEEIDTTEHPAFELALVTDEIAVYINPGDDVLTMDLSSKTIMDEVAGVKKYHETMEKIINHGKEYEYGEKLVSFCKRNHAFENKQHDNDEEGHTIPAANFQHRRRGR